MEACGQKGKKPTPTVNQVRFTMIFHERGIFSCRPKGRKKEKFAQKRRKTFRKSERIKKLIQIFNSLCRMHLWMKEKALSQANDPYPQDEVT